MKINEIKTIINKSLKSVEKLWSKLQKRTRYKDLHEPSCDDNIEILFS